MTEGQLQAPSTQTPAVPVPPAAAEGAVVMAAMDVGWSDIGSWTALVDAITGESGSIAGARVVEAGASADTTEEDVVVEPIEGRLTCRVAAAGTIEAERPLAVLAGARSRLPEIRSLLDRVARAEGSGA